MGKSCYILYCDDGNGNKENLAVFLDEDRANSTKLEWDSLYPNYIHTIESVPFND